jgi:hemolysin activation/secretion protein
MSVNMQKLPAQSARVERAASACDGAAVMRLGWGSLILACALSSATMITQAQALPGPPGITPFPDVGALQRAREQQREYLQAPQQAPQAPEPVIKDEQQIPPAPGSVSSAKFELKQLDFNASSYLSAADLDAIRAAHVGKEVDYNGLQAIVEEVNALYRKRGALTARAILPPQKVRGGAIKIELIEGKLGKVSFSGNKIVHGSWLSDWLEIAPGEPLDTAKLERRIELFNHANDTRLDARLRPGESFGYTDVLLQAQELPRYQLRTFASNEGSTSVGRNQVGLEGAINSPFGIGDRLGAYYLHSGGSDSGSINYTLPVNRAGGRLGISYSDLDSRVVSGPYEDFDVKGRSRSAQIIYRQPLLQRGAWWFDGSVAASTSHNTNEILGANLSDERVKAGTVGLIASGLYENRSFTFGVTDSYNEMHTNLNDDRHANIVNVNGSWIEKISDVQYTVLRASAQQTNTQLLSPSLLLQLGGSATVRGYPLGVVAGDNGYFANLEWHHAIVENVSGFLFGDTGTVRTSGSPNERVSSLGFGVDARVFKTVDFNLTVGRASDIILPDQGRIVVTARVSWQIL